MGIVGGYKHWWTRQDLNLGPWNYEFPALTN
jgi:hypothetical protein